MPLGDTDYSDTTYTGAPPTSGESSALSLDYYRNKAREFQVTLDAVAQGMAAAQYAIDTEAVDSDTMLELYNMLQEADGKRMLFRITAEAINAGAAVVNAAGGRFPQLSVPSGLARALGVLPVIPLAAIGALATAATLITWGTTWLRGLNDRLRLAVQLDAVTDPAARANLAQAVALSDAAVSAAQSSPLASIASLVKWGALGLGAWLVFRAYSARR